jgi:hypothetical protein
VSWVLACEPAKFVHAVDIIEIEPDPVEQFDYRG